MLKVDDNLFKRDIIKEIMSKGQPIGTIHLQLTDGKVSMPVRHFILNWFFWKIYYTFGIPICKHHVIEINIVNKKNISNLLTKIFNEIMGFDNFDGYKNSFNHTKRDQVLLVLANCIDDIDNFGMVWCVEYCGTLDIVSLSHMIEQPKIKALRDKIDPDVTFGTDKAEASINAAANQLIDMLDHPETLDYNCLDDFYDVGVLKTNMIPQMFLAYGTRSDINGSMFPHCINHSAIEGIESFMDLVAESLSAKKAMFFNTVMVTKAQYNNRKLQLNSSAIKHIYPGDCGTTVFVPFNVTEENHNVIKGKYVQYKNQLWMAAKYDNPSNKEVATTRFIDTTVMMRSPFGCRYRDGVCEVCGGKLTWYIHKSYNLGISCVISFWAAVTQIVLSTKHLNKSLSQLYKPSKIARQFLKTKGDNIYWSPQVRESINKWTVSISASALSPLDDLFDLDLPVEDSGGSQKKQVPIPDPERFTLNLTKFTIHKHGGNESIVSTEIDLTTDHNTLAIYLSEHALRFIKINIESVQEEDGMYHIPLKDFNHKKPFFSYLIMNDDMPAYVRTVQSFLDSTIGTYTSVPDLLKDFTDILYKKVTTNIFFIEVVLRSFLMTNQTDKRIPVLDDIYNVMLAPMRKSVINKGVSNKLLHEDLRAYFESPETYLYPVPAGEFDHILGLNKD